MAKPAPQGKRLDIQGIRAIAVAAVVVYHAFPQALPGGFVGVDIFFVLSGFLMTKLLRRDYANGSWSALRDFLIRRMRRLFPAAAVVITATLFVLYLWGPLLRFKDYATDAAASLLYVANVRFSASETGYFAHETATPFLHLWSLSIEEQFYIGLALLLLLTRKASNRIIIIVLSALFAASLTFSILASASAPDFSYYHLPARGWEFLVGALVSVTVPHWSQLRRDTANYVRWVGVATLVVSLVVINQDRTFPGWIALLPTLGTAAILVSGYSRRPARSRKQSHPDPARWLLESRPLVYLGDISYSLYLWHWPLLTLPVIIVGHAMSTPQILAALAASLLLGMVSYHFIEQPIRIKHGVSLSVARNLVVSSLAVATVLGLTVSLSVFSQQRLDHVLLAQTTRAASLPGIHSGSAMSSIPLPSAVSPTAASAPMVKVADPNQTPIGNKNFLPAKQISPALTDPGEISDPQQMGCLIGFNDTVVKVCTYKPPKTTVASPKTMLLYGDSQANMLWPMMKAIAQARGWKLSMIVKGACPAADIPGFAGAPPGIAATCPVWQAASLKLINQNPPDLIVVASLADVYQSGSGLPLKQFNQKWAQSVASYAKKLPATSKKLFVTDRPVFKVDPVQCLSKNLTQLSACNAPLSSLIQPDRIAAEQQLLKPLGFTFLDLNDGICPGGICSAVQKNYITYLDTIHMTSPFSLALAPFAWDSVSRGMGVSP